MKRLGIIFFSAWVWSASFAIMAVTCLLTYALRPILPYRKTAMWLAMPAFALCVRLTFSRLRVTYDPEFDPERRSVFCFNHTNLLDAHSAANAIPHPFCGLMHAWQFKIPIYGWMMGVSRGIRVHPHRKNNFACITEEAKKRREEGFSILTFPEGHRTKNGKVHKFERGVFFIAKEAGYPVVPVGVRGMFAINQKGSWIFRPGHVHIHVGRQFETEDKSERGLIQLARQLQQWVSDFVDTGQTQPKPEALAS